MSIDYKDILYYIFKFYLYATITANSRGSLPRQKARQTKSLICVVTYINIDIYNDGEWQQTPPPDGLYIYLYILKLYDST